MCPVEQYQPWVFELVPKYGERCATCWLSLTDRQAMPLRLSKVLGTLCPTFLTSGLANVCVSGHVLEEQGE